jgi:hypothetical protein
LLFGNWVVALEQPHDQAHGIGLFEHDHPLDGQPGILGDFGIRPDAATNDDPVGVDRGSILETNSSNRLIAKDPSGLHSHQHVNSESLHFLF